MSENAVDLAIQGVSDVVSSLTSFLDTISSCLGSTASSRASQKPQEVASKRNEVEKKMKKLEKSLLDIKTHMNREASCEKVRKTIEKRVETIEKCEKSSRIRENLLKKALGEAKGLLESPMKSTISPRELYGLARKLGYTSFAPLDWHMKEGTPLPHGFQFPYPTMLRLGVLAKDGGKLVEQVLRELEAEDGCELGGRLVDGMDEMDKDGMSNDAITSQNEAIANDGTELKITNDGLVSHGMDKDEMDKDGMSHGAITSRDEAIAKDITELNLTNDGPVNHGMDKDGIGKDEMDKDGVDKDEMNTDGMGNDVIDKVAVTSQDKAIANDETELKSTNDGPMVNEMDKNVMGNNAVTSQDEAIVNDGTEFKSTNHRLMGHGMDKDGLDDNNNRASKTVDDGAIITTDDAFAKDGVDITVDDGAIRTTQDGLAKDGVFAITSMNELVSASFGMTWEDDEETIGTKRTVDEVTWEDDDEEQSAKRTKM